MPSVVIRYAGTEDVPFLWDMLYASMFTPEGEAPLPRTTLQLPEISKYMNDWGRDGDIGFIAAADDGSRIGSVTLRYFTEEDPGYGFVDSNIPELGMAISEQYRGMGIGTLLITKALEEARSQEIPGVSLSVDPRNRAMGLYERFGFVEIGKSGTSVTMLVKITKD